MRYHSQNLNESKGKAIGSMFWRGRAWFYLGRDRYRESFHVEWLFGKYARDFAITATFGTGDSDAGVCLHICLPWIFSVYLVLDNIYRCRESRTGFGIHSSAIWFYPLTDENESRRDHPWWKKTYSWYFPWQYDWYSTEILEHTSPICAKTLHMERSGDCKKLGIDGFEMMRRQDVYKKRATETYEYSYTLKNGTVQNVKAEVLVERRVYRMRWWPLLHFKHVSTSIWVNFSSEVGEETGSWKGGTTGCGYDFKYQNETPLEVLRRMESERKF